MTSFTDDQLRPVAPTSPPITPGCNVRHRNPPPELSDAPGKVNNVVGDLVDVSWHVKGKMGPRIIHDKSELECTD